jgi:predicted nucleic acid-binding protein
MILVDTSFWIDHFRRGNDALRALLESGDVMSHPFVVGELACGALRNRSGILELLARLPQASVAEPGEVMRLVESKKLYTAGVGWIDAHLIASALLTGVGILTLDKPLLKAASALGIAASGAL